MLEDNHKLLAVGASYFLTVYPISEKVDGNSSGYPRLTKDILPTKPFDDYDPRRFLQFFAHGDVLIYDMTRTHSAQSKKGKAREIGFTGSVGVGSFKVASRASENVASRLSLTEEEENGKTTLYRLLITSNMITNKHSSFWGPTFHDLLKFLETPSEKLQQFYDSVGTHFVREVEVGRILGSRSEQHQSSMIRGNTQFAALSLLEAVNVSASGSRKSGTDHNIGHTERHEQGSQSQPIVLLKHVAPLWTLEPLRGMENEVDKMKKHFFYKLEVLRLSLLKTSNSSSKLQ